jgi:predicted nucleic acid-binding protein
MLVLDCSVLMAWIIPDECSDYAQAVRKAITQYPVPILAPPLFFLEAINVLEVMRRRKRISDAQAENALQTLTRLPITIDTESVHLPVTLQVRELMQRHQLTAYDASYLELAIRRHLPLSTLDKALRLAAEAESVFFVV